MFEFEDFIDTLIDFLINSVLLMLLTGGGILGLFKSLMWIYSSKFVSFIMIYINRKRFYEHDVLYKINDLLKNNYITISINDICKKEIADDIVDIEIETISFVIVKSLNDIIKNNIFSYIKCFKNISSEYIVSIFYKNYTNIRQNLKDKIKKKLTNNNNMSDGDFEIFWNIYYEYISNYEIYIYELLKVNENNKNFYGTLWKILDQFNAYLEVFCKTFGIKFNLMNGRINNISYKNKRIKQNIS